ncbi:MAG TPA: ATP-dependent DNA helicase [Candidatus Saccharimonadales bacterium]|nr:ATP-dependent DNA helicase [Candidatus Saccharimonadales bacterium]
MDYLKRYAKLNPAQKQAVDTIDGPVIVIAGPGTGKTELLSVRTANILQRTDTLPENILCLTFTESGANAMRQRLTEIIGKDAYKVAVHTFHSFGIEVINQNGQFFYRGAHFMPADELSSYEIISDIFKELKYDNPLAGKLNDEYTHLSDSLSAISELKKSGLTSDELLAILDENNAVIEKAEQLLAPIFANRVTKNTALQAKKQIDAIRQSNGHITLPTVVPLSQVLADALENAINESDAQNSTKPITAWKNQWFKKNESGNLILKSRERQTKLRALGFVYEKYLTNMQKAALYDFDDMILRVVHAMEVFDDLRFNLQEKYQYIMVDEFQDTNMAQMRILHNLTNNPVQGDTPNILVVGDDDQAIYSFQGADVSNIIDFRDNYPKSAHITLTENYRSTSDILKGSREIIVQGKERLENIYDDIDKKLSAHNHESIEQTHLFEAETIADERHFVVSDIKSRINDGEKPGDITILTRRHNEIHALLPYFSKAKIPVNYERRDNVLDKAPIKLIEKLARLLIDISKGNHGEVNANLPEILAHKAWGIEPIELWQLSIKAYDGHMRWLEIMAKSPRFLPIYNWLVATASQVEDTPLEYMLDIIIGKPNSTANEVTEFTSPLYDYYFSKERLENNANDYLLYLESLRTIRAKLREYRPNQTPTLSTFIEFISLNRKIGSTISVIRRAVQTDEAVNIMTAHKSKGLEFDTVYVVNAIDTIWGQRARSRNRLIGYPENLQIAPAGETEDERLRLFYVAITRAKKNLHISYSLTDDSGRDTLKAAFLVDSGWAVQQIPPPDSFDQLVESTELAWYQPLIDPTTKNMQELLLPGLENYKLSVTHLHNFLDVSRGGPASFLLQNLLHFPSAKSPNAAFGTAIHDTLQSAHAHLTSTGKKQAIEDIISTFEKNLKNQYMKKVDYSNFLQKGSEALQVFFDKMYDTFRPNQQTEIDFTGQHSMVDKAHLTGKLDLVEIDKKNKTIAVIDYKTGKATRTWNGKTEYEKIKLHKYKQQLLFYKLMTESSRDYHNYQIKSATIRFIEPTSSGDIISLDVEFNQDELDRFSKLINAVWSHVVNLNLPDISGYKPTYEGIIKFEQDLIDKII